MATQISKPDESGAEKALEADKKGLIEAKNAPKDKDLKGAQEAAIEENARKRLEGLKESNINPDDLKNISTAVLGEGKTLDSQTIASLTSQELIAAEGKLNGSLNVLFGSRVAKDEKGNENVKALRLGDKYEVGDKVKVDFKGNEDAYWNIGAGDMMLENVRAVKITDDKGQTRVSTMRQGLKGGFYDDAGYIPVFDNYTIEIAEVLDEAKMTEYKKDLAKRSEEEAKHLNEIYKKNPGASRGKARDLESILEKPNMKDLDALMDEALEKYNLNKEYKPVLYSFIQHESNFDIHADASKNCPTSSAYGLFQMLKGHWKWTYAELVKEPRFANYSMENFRNSLDSQVYAGILYFKKMDVKPVEQTLRRNIDPKNPHDVLLLYVAHHEGGGDGGLGHYIRTGKFKSGQIGDSYAWKVVNGAEAYRQQIARRNGLETAKSIYTPDTVAEESGSKDNMDMGIKPKESQSEQAIERSSRQETAFMGDSITVGMGNSGALEGAGKFGIGGENTTQMLKRFQREVINGGYKKVVILAGVNSIGSGWTVEKTAKDLAKMYQMAREAGIKVVACLLPPAGKYWETNGWHLKAQAKMGLTPDVFSARINELNKWIRSQEGSLVDKVVNLPSLMADKNNSNWQKAEFASSDGLHQNRKGSQAMAEFIKREGNIA